MSAATTTALPRLAGLQRAFRSCLLNRDDSLRMLVANSDGTNRETGIDVYREGYALRLIEALEADFAGLLAVTGGQEFDSLARAYIEAHPSRHPSLRWFGRDLAGFLASTPPWRASAALTEMAQFEWALGEAWDAADGSPVPVSELLALPAEAWETLSFAVVASLRTLTLSFDVPQAWQRREQVESRAIEVASASCGPVTWVVWRDDTQVQYRALEIDEADVFRGLIAGQAFPQLCERLAAPGSETEAVARAAGLLRAWVEAGLIGSFAYRSTDP